MQYGYFSDFMNSIKQQGGLAIQPRMGFGLVSDMRDGLIAVSEVSANTIGTLTLDSYTRVNSYQQAAINIVRGDHLNGYPIVSYGSALTRHFTADIQRDNFPLQVRHGTAFPYDIFKVMLASGIYATEGGPISYCLPYSRMPLTNTLEAWASACELLANTRSQVAHLESFAGCMLGQLCPPDLLIALSILEGIFFRYFGLKDISLSFVQNVSPTQDLAALNVLQKLIHEYLPDINTHVVVYSYMGLFPETEAGTQQIIKDSVLLAKQGKATRLIVKTHAESKRIPTVEENISAIVYANDVFSCDNTITPQDLDEEALLLRNAKNMINTALSLHSDPRRSLAQAFCQGYLDVPYCLHPDNKNLTRSYLDHRDYLCWASTGNMPIANNNPQFSCPKKMVKSKDLLAMLSCARKKYDAVPCVKNMM